MGMDLWVYKKRREEKSFKDKIYSFGAYYSEALIYECLTLLASDKYSSYQNVCNVKTEGFVVTISKLRALSTLLGGLTHSGMKSSKSMECDWFKGHIDEIKKFLEKEVNDVANNDCLYFFEYSW